MVPGTPVSVLAGYLWGPLWGFLYALIGATLGAAICFILTRLLFYAIVKDFFQKRGDYRVLLAAMQKEGWKVVMVCRLTPIFPFNFLNYAFGLTPVGFWSYFWATFTGMIPGTFLITYGGVIGYHSMKAGSENTGISQVVGNPSNIIFLLSLVSVLYLTDFARKLWERYKEKYNKES
ncbi:TVP38/TMEM64 family protein [Candidatus Riflebacteria bacterium]